jgi:hypothetical protein
MLFQVTFHWDPTLHRDGSLSITTIAPDPKDEFRLLLAEMSESGCPIPALTRWEWERKDLTRNLLSAEFLSPLPIEVIGFQFAEVLVPRYVKKLEIVSCPERFRKMIMAN